MEGTGFVKRFIVIIGRTWNGQVEDLTMRLMWRNEQEEIDLSKIPSLLFAVFRLYINRPITASFRTKHTLNYNVRYPSIQTCSCFIYATKLFRLD